MTSFGGGNKPRFDPKEMSVKETEFVQNEFSVEPDVYCQIKAHVWEGLAAQAREDGAKQAKADAKKTAKEELKQEVTAELMPGLVSEAEKKAMSAAIKKAKEELEPQVRAELLEKLKDDWKKESLTDEDRRAYAAALRDIEVESLTFATSSSKEAEREGAGTDWSKRVRHGLLATSLVGLGPFAVWLLASRDWHTVAFWLTALPYAVIVTYCAIMASRAPVNRDQYGDRRKTDADKMRKFSSDYLQIASQARLVRHLYLNTRIRRDVQAEFDVLSKRKAALDEQYQPSVDLIEEVKPQVRVRLSEEIDPEKLYADHFDEKLEEAEAKKAG